MSALRKLLDWYFNKKSLPYWCLLLLDSMIVFLSAIFVYWIFRKSQILFNFRHEVFYTALIYTVLSAFGARIFRTYSGILRYSSFVDLLKVAYSNILSLFLALLWSEPLQYYGYEKFAALTTTETLGVFFLSTMLMCAMRVVIKTLYDITSTTPITINTLIYGAMSGGVGLAKNIQSARPKTFELCGFISHDPGSSHIQLMGKDVYNLNDDLLDIIRKKRIGAVLVSPLRVKDFRNNEELQNLLINAGVKIFMTKGAIEARV